MLSLHTRVITVSRLKLIESLHKNYEIHKIEYAQAIKDYQIALISELKKAIKKASKISDEDIESIKNIEVDFDAPISHTEDYRKAIQMLEYSNSDDIEVDENAFEAYVNNNWPWKNSFMANAIKYAGMSGRLS